MKSCCLLLPACLPGLSLGVTSCRLCCARLHGSVVCVCCVDLDALQLEVVSGCHMGFHAMQLAVVESSCGMGPPTCKYSSLSRCSRSTIGTSLTLHASSSHRVDSLQQDRSTWRMIGTENAVQKCMAHKGLREVATQSDRHIGTWERWTHGGNEGV